MKTIKQIEKYIDRAMCVDRPVLIRSVRKLKKGVREGMDYSEYKISGPTPSPHELEDAFRHEIFNLLKKEGMITDFVIENVMGQYDDLAPQRI